MLSRLLGGGISTYDRWTRDWGQVQGPMCIWLVRTLKMLQLKIAELLTTQW